jgi:hypothetical protein
MPRDNQFIVYLNDAEYTRMKKLSNETGKSMSELGRRAVLEYTDLDRLDRMEERLDEIESLLRDRLSDGGAHTHKQSASTKGSETVEKTRRIAERVQQNYPLQLTTEELERPIKDIAGGDPRTIEKYKDELKERALIFENPHPETEVWNTQLDHWAGSVEGYAEKAQDFKGAVREVIEPYGVTLSDLIPHFEREWETEVEVE